MNILITFSFAHIRGMFTFSNLVPYLFSTDDYNKLHIIYAPVMLCCTSSDNHNYYHLINN